MSQTLGKVWFKMSGISGGEKLLKYLEAIERGFDTAKSVDVGWNSNNMHPEAKTYTATVAAWQEFGTKFIPARPFMAPARLENETKWSKEVAKEMSACGYNAEIALAGVGEVVKKDIQKAIMSVNAPKLAQSTIDKKGFDKPLIDSSYMIDHIDVEVKK